MNSTRIQQLRDLAATGQQGPKSSAIIELCDALQERTARREKPKFTLRDVMVEAERMHWASGLAEQCSDTYERVGWMTGRNPIVSLPAAMRTWMRNHQKWNGNNGKPKTSDFAL